MNPKEKWAVGDRVRATERRLYHQGTIKVGDIGVVKEIVPIPGDIYGAKQAMVLWETGDAKGKILGTTAIKKVTTDIHSGGHLRESVGKWTVRQELIRKGFTDKQADKLLEETDKLFDINIYQPRFSNEDIAIIFSCLKVSPKHIVEPKPKEK